MHIINSVDYKRCYWKDFLQILSSLHIEGVMELGNFQIIVASSILELSKTWISPIL